MARLRALVAAGLALRGVEGLTSLGVFGASRLSADLAAAEAVESAELAALEPAPAEVAGFLQQDAEAESSFGLLADGLTEQLPPGTHRHLQAGARAAASSGSAWLARQLSFLQSAAEVVGSRSGIVAALRLAEPAWAPEPTTPAPTAPPPTPHPYAAILVYFVLVAAMGFFYRLHRATPPVDMKRARSLFKGQDFQYGAFECFGDMEVCCWSFWCPAIRYADTMNAVSLLGFWVALSVFVVVQGVCLIPGLFILWAIAAMLFTYFRQEMRRVLEMENESFATDLFLWCCCACCAVVQEARQVKAVTVLEVAEA